MKPPRKRKSIYIYPNRFGFLFVGSFVLSVLLGATYENNMLFLFAFVQLGFIFVAILITAGEIRAAELLSASLTGGFPQEAVPLKLLLANHSETEIEVAINFTGGTTIEAQLTAKQTRLVEVPLVLPEIRGAYSLDRIRLFTSGPFLFFNCWKYRYIHLSYYVFPKPVGQSLPLRTSAVDVANVSGLEEYTGSQSIGRISWRHYGRTGKLMIKSAEAAGQGVYVFDSADLSHLDHESVCSQLCKWICEAENAGVAYSLCIPGFRSQSSVGTQHRNQLLVELAKWNA